MEITSTTKLIGLIGHPIGHSLSPKIQNQLTRETGLDVKYLAFDVLEKSLEEAVFGFRALGALGFNVTIPHKVNILKYIDELSEEARLIGAVNTVVVKNGRLIGHNTDGRGFTQSIKEEGIDILGKTIAFLGAGGAARAAAFQSALDGIGGIIIVNRDMKRAMHLARDIRGNFDNISVECLSLEDFERKKRMIHYDILVNSTPLGTYPDINQSIIRDPYLFIEGKVAYDMVYNPIRTHFLMTSASRGMKTISGIEMLINQGLLAFELWTGKKVEKKNLNLVF